MTILKTDVITEDGEATNSGGQGLLARVKNDPEITSYMELADRHLGVAGYTEHGIRHGSRVGKSAAQIMRELGYSDSEVELAAVAGYLHDIGNFVCRTNHGQTAAALIYPILRRLGFDNIQTGLVLSAIGNHEEQYGQVYNNICAAVVIGDKSDVHRSRVRHFDPGKNDIHDNVNYAVTESRLVVKREAREIDLVLTIDDSIATVMDYFEIFISRMVMCRGAAGFLGCSFRISCNGTVLS